MGNEIIIPETSRFHKIPLWICRLVILIAFPLALFHDLKSADWSSVKEWAWALSAKWKKSNPTKGGEA